MNDVSRLEKALDTFQKNVDTSFAGPIPNSLLARQDLEQAAFKTIGLYKYCYIGEP